MVEAGAKIKKTVEENVSNNLRESFFLFLNITFSFLSLYIFRKIRNVDDLCNCWESLRIFFLFRKVR